MSRHRLAINRAAPTLGLLAVIVFIPATSSAQVDPCVVTDNGSGTVDLPPQTCFFAAPQQVYMIIGGLPAGTTIELEPVHRGFFGPSAVPGGSLGGEVETFDSTMVFRARGTGGKLRRCRAPCSATPTSNR
jgi:hypothetical protein